ncbi:phosphoribosylaminoimidazolecarboxamide formyltransferase [Desulfobacca acetoxidans]|uniref:Phosphoribosylaminoimidazole carboxamideformyltransferase n=1 Tax=Desulfobacca acetoxidans (strain ATCC 700848 / DSM 11109 / ASRB2) TaxID=880072 RepID=F2NII3_DESAR|nr:phosphoribosylaminoimidazolecarboxamide formyltransferase [Desulfobacca acetoxidans]AEB10385.1 Phosphoribosylaminoimidazole carboxamideformyltransferase [Desulfobacca acetoxidans DSM 11109]
MNDIKKMYRTVMDDHFPEKITIEFGDQKLKYRKRTWKLSDDKTGEVIEKGLRYGENPGQEAALYELVKGHLELGGCRFLEPGYGMVSAIDEAAMLQAGKHPGKTNLTDIDNSLNIIKFLLKKPCVVIVKHNNPCGVAYGDTLAQAYDRANMADRIAAFGGCAVFNRAMDRTTAELVVQNYLEVIAAPDYEAGVVDILKVKKDLRIIQIPHFDRLADLCQRRFVEFKSLNDGGLVVQQSPLNAILKVSDFKPAVATHQGVEYRTRPANAAELEDLLFGWQVEQGVTSNSVLYVKDGCTVGIGTGEQDRVGVAEIAIYKAYIKYADALCFKKLGKAYKDLELEIEQGKAAKALKDEIDAETKTAKGGLIGAAMISDAFFPFRDGVDVALRQGIQAIAHAGGSLRDFESIQACNEAQPPAAMVFTGQRAFKH